MTNTQKLEEFLTKTVNYAQAQQTLQGLAGQTPEEQAKGRAAAIAFLQRPRDQGGEGLTVRPDALDERVRDDVAGAYSTRRGHALAFYTAEQDAILKGLPDSNLEALVSGIPVSKKLDAKYEPIAKAEKPLLELQAIAQLYATKQGLSAEAERDAKEKLAGLAEKAQKQLLDDAQIDKRFAALSLQMARQRAYLVSAQGIGELVNQIGTVYGVNLQKALTEAGVSQAEYARAKLTAYAQDKPDEAMDLTARIALAEQRN